MVYPDGTIKDLSPEQILHVAIYSIATYRSHELTSRYRIERDSVAGAKCLVIYRDGKPVANIWNEDVAPMIRRIDAGIAHDITNLAKSVKEMGGSFDQLQDALITYFNEKGD